MDVARRWQIATALTAVGGLGAGALALGNQPSEAVPSIELEVADAPASALAPDRDDAGDAEETSSEIVAPDVRSLGDSPLSLDSPDDGATRSPATGGDTAPPAPTRTPAPAGRHDSPPSADSPPSSDSPDSVASADSLDSDD